MQVPTILLLSLLANIDHAAGRPKGVHARAVPVRRDASDAVPPDPVSLPPSSASSSPTGLPHHHKKEDVPVFNLTKVATKTITMSMTTPVALPTPGNITKPVDLPGATGGSPIPAPTPTLLPLVDARRNVTRRSVDTRRVPQLFGGGPPRLGFLAPSPPTNTNLTARDANVKQPKTHVPRWKPWFGGGGPPWGSHRPTPKNFTSPPTDCPFRNFTKRDLAPRKPGFTVTQVLSPRLQNTTDTPRNGLQAMMEAYAKYGADVPPAIRLAMKHNPSIHSINRRNTMAGVVEAIPERNDFEYLSPVQIGTPLQTLNLAIDTGSADLWVLTTLTPPSLLTSHKIYSPLLSLTSSPLPNHTWSIHYGDGSTASGSVYTDTLSLGPITSPRQTVQSASHVSRAFTYDAACSGILGLGFSHGSSVRPGKALTFMDSVRHKLEEEVFTADLKRGAPGKYGFGFVDRGSYVGKMGYAGVWPRSSVWWRFNVTASGSGTGGEGKGGSGMGMGAMSAIADTGTSLLLVPRGVVGEYYGRVRGSGYDVDWAGWVFPCETALPDWSFWLADGYKGTVPGRYMVYSRVNGTHCFGGMQSSEGIPFAIFGDVVLKAQFVVFDVGEKRVGFASKVLTS